MHFDGAAHWYHQPLPAFLPVDDDSEHGFTQKDGHWRTDKEFDLTEAQLEDLSSKYCVMIYTTDDGERYLALDTHKGMFRQR